MKIFFVVGYFMLIHVQYLKILFVIYLICFKAIKILFNKSKLNFLLLGLLNQAGDLLIPDSASVIGG